MDVINKNDYNTILYLCENELGTDEEKELLNEDELKSERKAREEFQNLTNSQVFEHVFRHYMMSLKQGVAVARSPSDFLGLDSEELMLPLLHKTLLSVMNNTIDSIEFHMLDVEFGSCGDTIDWCFARELEKNIPNSRQNIIHIIEQNPTFLQLYQQKLLEYHHLSQGIVYNGRVQDYYCHCNNYDDHDTSRNLMENTISPPLPSVPIDFINCMNAIHHLTDCTSNVIDPYGDIIKFVKFLYGLLKPGGAMYISFLDMEQCTFITPIIKKYYKEVICDLGLLERFTRTIKARNDLLYEGNIVNYLSSSKDNNNNNLISNICNGNDNNDGKAKLTSYRLQSSFYARSLADIAAAAVLGGLTSFNGDKFDVKLLDYLSKEIKSSISDNYDDFCDGEKGPLLGLTRCIRGDESVWKIDQPFIVSIISKEKEK